MRLSKLLALGLATVAFAAPAFAQDWKGRGRLNGVVTDEAGAPVEGAAITLRVGDRPELGPPAIKTDKKGKWGYLGLMGGAWAVRIEKEGFVPSEGSVNVNEFGVNPLVSISIRKPTAVAAAEAPQVDPKLAAAQEAIDLGDEFLRNKQGAEALAEYQKALPALEGNNHLIVLKRIASAQMIAGDDAAAVETLKAVLVESPGDSDSIRLIVDRLIILKREAEAQEFLAQMPEGASLDPNTMLNMGINLYNENKLAEALAQFEKVVAANPEMPEGYYYRGLTQLGLGRTKESKADFEKVLAIAPDHRLAADCREFVKSL